MVEMSETGFVNAGVIGTGMMGPGIALTLALGGVRTTIVSRSPEGAERGVAKALSLAKRLVEDELADAALVERAIGLLTGSPGFDETVAAADLVIESGPEDLAWKQQLFARMGAL